MVIAPGDSEGGPKNGRRYGLRAGSLLLIEQKDEHEITALGREPLRTLNVYVPRAYTKRGDELRAAKP
jgi:hypothetical protein